MNIFNNALGGTQNIYVALKTYEDIMSQSQERPEKDLIPPLQQEELLKAYIRFLADDQTLKEGTIQSIVNIAGCIPFT